MFRYIYDLLFLLPLVTFNDYGLTSIISGSDNWAVNFLERISLSEICSSNAHLKMFIISPRGF